MHLYNVCICIMYALIIMDCSQSRFSCDIMDTACIYLSISCIYPDKLCASVISDDVLVMGYDGQTCHYHSLQGMHR